jgi:hypothetical protein
MRSTTHKVRQLVGAIWVLNAAALLVILALLAWHQSDSLSTQSLPPTITKLADKRASPSPTPDPTVHYLPTITPNPLTTPIVYPSPTPFLLASGQRPLTIGYSAGGRPLEVYQFGDGPFQRMIVAGIHGGSEWNTIVLADQLITYLSEHPELIPNDVTLYVLHNLNPDGEARAHGPEGRLNDNGVDLNRNFPDHWQATWDRDGCWDYEQTSAGSYPGSEPETKALMNFINLHPKLDALISYHSAALGVFPGGIPWTEDSKHLAKTVSKLGSYPYPPIDTGCVYTGTLADWAADHGLAAVDLELTNHRDTDYEQNVKILQMLLNWNWWSER